MYIKQLMLMLVLLNSGVAIAQECKITAADNPNITYSINPNVTYKWNPDVTCAINPNVTYSINPNVTYKYNPNVTYSINPNVTIKLNPHIGSWEGFYICTPEGELIGASVIANEDVMVKYIGKKWIGHFVTNKKGGYNYFNRDNEWKGFLVPTETGGFVFFNREKKWVFSLIKGTDKAATNISKQQAAPSSDVIESQIDGDFEGWEGDTIIKLMNGQIWQQTEYYYHYHYDFMPKVLIYKSGYGYKMKVDGVEKAVGVTRLK